MIRVVASTRKAFTVEIGGKSRRFWTEAAAYYAIAKSLIGKKYLAAIAMVDAAAGSSFLEASDVERARAERGRELFYCPGDSRRPADARDCFDSKRWTAYVRRVAKKLRAMDARRGAA